MYAAIHTILSQITPNNFALQVNQRFKRDTPHIIWRFRNAEPENAKSSPAMIKYSDLELRIYNPDIIAANTMAQEIEDLFESISGVYDGYVIQRMLWSGQSDDYIEELALNMIHQEYAIRCYKSVVPADTVTADSNVITADSINVDASGGIN